MHTTYTDVTAGARLDIAVEFVTRQSIDCAAGRVERLLVTDSEGTQFTVLVAPDSGPLVDLQTGATHTITGLLGAVPVSPSHGIEAECPDCGAQLRLGQAVDTADEAVAEAAAHLDLDGPFGIVDDSTAVRRVRETGAPVDDWTPMREDRSVTVPDCVCTDCGAHVDARAIDDPAAVGGLVESRCMSAGPVSQSAETVGLAGGGAMDVTSFRENVAEGYTPQPEAISDEGLFHDYHFETGDAPATEALFAPRHAVAVSEHPLTGETERYLSVGLDSTLAVDDFERPTLDLVAVLDVSGSMSSPFDEYYYDEQGRRREAETDGRTKLQAATEFLCALTEQLAPGDRLGVVLYNHRAHVAKPLRDVARTDMPAIRRHIREIAAGGSTNMADGFEAAVDMLVDGRTGPDVERRVVFMTDMMPNTGATEERELTDLFADAAVDGIHTTFIGMGLDANAALADRLSGIRGANHQFVHSAAEFERRLGETFDHMVTPLVHDLSLDLVGEGHEIAAVHGSPSTEGGTDRLVHVGTLFPSAKQDGEARGGVILVRLAGVDPDADLELVASWTERDGAAHTERMAVESPDALETFTHDGIRKAVALARYAREVRRWAADVHGRGGDTGVDDWQHPDGRGQHERTSVPLSVSAAHADRFERLQGYLETEREALGDETLQQEVDLLARLCRVAPAAEAEVRD